MLINNITEFRKYVQATAAFKFEQVEAHLKKAQDSDITRIFGAIVATLNTRWNNGAPSPALSAKEAQIISYFQTAIANFGYVKALPFLSVQNTSSGTAQAETPQNKPLFKWQKMEIENEALENAWEAVESAIIYLIANRDDFNDWKNSANESAQLSNFINTAADFSTIYGINNSRRTFEALKSTMRDAENLFVKQSIGRALFDEIKTQIQARNVSTNNAILLKMIKDAVANITISIAIYKLELRFDENGARLVTSTSSGGNDTSRIKSAADAKTKEDISSRCAEIGKTYLGELVEYLTANAATYPLFTPPTVTTIDNSSGASFVL